MKLTLEINGLQSGKSSKEDNPYDWTTITGHTAKGVKCYAKAYDDTGLALEREIVKHTPSGEEIGTTRIVVQMTGEWRDGKPYKRASDGKTVTNRYFRISTFDILTGPQLELARLKRDLAAKLTLAEDLRASGRMGLAYRTIAEFAAVISNRELDLDDIAVSEEADEVVYGEPDAASSDPEAAAAARFASMDKVAEPMSIAKPAPSAVPAASDQLDADSAEPEAEIAEAAGDQPDDNDETAETEEAQEERDVLDDNAPEAEEEQVEESQPEPVAAAKLSAPPSRPAPQPSAAPAQAAAAARPPAAPAMRRPPAPGRMPPPPRI